MKNTFGSRNLRVLIGVLVIPLLIAAAFLAGTWGQNDRLSNVKAAVVNDDKAVTINGQYVPLGRQLSAELANRKDANVTWVLADRAGAIKGLESGEFAAVVTIPENFSAAATSTSKNDGDKAQQATISVQTSPAAGVADAAIAQQIAQLATDSLNATLTKTYLENVYVGFNTTGKQFTTISDAAQQLATGASQLAPGAKAAADGAAQLDGGMKSLAAAGKQLTAGSTELSSGANTLANSGSQLSSGASQLAAGQQQLATGAQTLADNTKAYTDGTAQALGGVQQVAGGLNQLKTQLASGGSADLGSQLKPMTVGSQGVADGTAGISQGLTQYSQAMKGLATQNPPALDPIPGADQVAANCAAQGGTPQICTQMVETYKAGFGAGSTYGWKAGLGAAVAGIEGQGDPSKSLVANSAKVAEGAKKLDAGVDQLATEMPKQVAAQQAQLLAGVTKLADGANQVAAASEPLISGGKQLSTGTQQLATGAKQSSAGASALSSGVSQYVDGASSLATGIEKYTDGVGQFAAGVDQVAAKTPALASGLTQLSDGTAKLANGTQTFASELKKGASQVPSYSEAQRVALSKVAARPVQNPQTAPQSAALAPVTVLVLALGLWLGGLALFALMKPVPASVLTSSKSSLALLAKTLTPGLIFAAVEAIVLGALGSRALGLGFTKGLGLVGLLFLAALTFVLVNHALAAWLRGAGRVIAIVLATVAIAVGTTAAVPGIFGSLHGFSPIKPLIDGIRGLVAGASMTGPVMGLIAWLLVAAVASVLAFARARSLSPKRYLRSAKVRTA